MRALLLSLLLSALFLIVGWINHVVWTFGQTDFTGLVIGTIGIFAAPIGALHGLYLFFV